MFDFTNDFSNPPILKCFFKVLKVIQLLKVHSILTRGSVWQHNARSFKTSVVKQCQIYLVIQPPPYTASLLLYLVVPCYLCGSSHVLCSTTLYFFFLHNICWLPVCHCHHCFCVLLLHLNHCCTMFFDLLQTRHLSVFNLLLWQYFT